LDQIAIDDSAFATIIQYHVYWPQPGNDPYYLYNVTENRGRNSYYQPGSAYTPHLFVDGAIDAGSNTGGWENYIFNESVYDAPLAMSMDGYYMADSLAGYVTITIIVEQDPALNNYKLRLALTESGLRYTGPNGLPYHNNVMRDMIPTHVGTAISLPAGDTLTYTFRFTTPSPLVAYNCQLVAFVQSDLNRAIVQGARIKIRDLSRVGIEEGIPVPRSMSLSQNYPNPFNAQTRIDFSTAGGLTTLDIYDITGAKVASLCKADLKAGDYSMVWDGCDQSGQPVSSGTYFYRLTNSSGQQTKRMTLLK
jgi:hypothetical protein